jgi:isochorismate hydrolase
LSDKQIEVATNQIEKEMGPITPVEEVKDRRFVDLVADIQKEFVSVLKNKVKQSKSVNEGVKRITKAFIKSNPYKIK